LFDAFFNEADDREFTDLDLLDPNKRRCDNCHDLYDDFSYLIWIKIPYEDRNGIEQFVETLKICSPCINIIPRDEHTVWLHRRGQHDENRSCCEWATMMEETRIPARQSENINDDDTW
jgi:hypothetical protein